MEIRPPYSKAVLSLDDDVEVCALLEHLLWPHRVIGVSHAYVALELLAREAFDLLILDVRMPDMDGLELCYRIRREDPNVPVVICSGAAGPADRELAIAAGASACYGKPLEPESFQAGIEQLLYEAEDRNRIAEAAVRELLDAWPQAAVLTALRDEEMGAGSPLREQAYGRFIGSGGTRAHFVRAWPGMLETALITAPALQPMTPAIGRHGG